MNWQRKYGLSNNEEDNCVMDEHEREGKHALEDAQRYCLHASWYYEPEYNKEGDIISEGDKICSNCGKKLN